MKILYVGQLWQGGTCLTRMQTLAASGNTCIPLDTTPFAQYGSRIERSLLYRANFGRGIRRLNQALQAAAEATHFDILWIDKGVWIYPETLHAMRKRATRTFSVHYTPDAQLVDNQSRHFVQCVPLYDLLVTTKPFELSAYLSIGAREVQLVLQGYGAQFQSAAGGLTSGPSSAVTFVGHYQPHYAERLRAATTATDCLSIWGPNWPRYAARNAWARNAVKGNGLWGESYPAALRGAGIALGLLGKHIPETTTTRTFEIPATGTFMLAERTDDHLALFEEGKEAEFFTSDDELAAKIRFYLAHDAAREAIARAGRERCLRSGYSDQHQLKCVISRICELLGEQPPGAP